MEFNHIPIMKDEVLNGLNIKSSGIYVDCTVGGAGHASLIAEKLDKKGMLICFDQDEDAIRVSKERLSKYNNTNIKVIRSNFEYIKERLSELGIEKVDGIIADLGVSSYQFDNVERGFSYKDREALLDMRMDKDSDIDAIYVLNNYSESELIRIFRDYGEERFSKRIASNIIKFRQENEILKVGELIDIVLDSIPLKTRIGVLHPEKRVFQALRIEVNKELDVLKNSLFDMIKILKEEGRLVIITFHSLEDRIVKHMYKEAEDSCTCKKISPICVCGMESLGKVITRKPIIPTEEEIEYNSRAKSSKLRIFERR